LDKISVPQSVQKQLSPGEDVVGKLASRGADYYATNGRLLRFTGESHYQSLEYSTLSVNSVSYGARIAICRVAAVVLGLFIIFTGMVVLTDPANVNGFPGGKPGFVLLLWVMGLGCAFFGASLRSSYYQMQAPGVREGDKEWRIGDPFRWTRSADKFVEILKQKSASH
jgi:hypothetical protein